MTKSDTIEAIVARNPTANRTFLAEFSNIELTEYMERLDECAAGTAVPAVAACASAT